MSNFKIPTENFSVVNYFQNELPAIAVIDAPLLKLSYKKDFTYCLALMIEFKAPAENGFPSEKELAEIDAFEDEIIKNLKGTGETPNALYLGRITWNGARDVYFRVENPEIAHEYLLSLYNNKDRTIKFEYMIKQDKKFKETDFLPKLLKRKK